MKPNLKSIREIAKEIVALYKEEVMEDKKLQELAKENNDEMVNRLCNDSIPDPMVDPEGFVKWQLRFVNENIMTYSEHTIDELKLVHLRFAEKARKIMGTVGKCPITVLEAIGEIDPDIKEAIEVHAKVGLYNWTESNREYREKLCKASEVFYMRRKDRVIEAMKRATIA